MKKNKILFTTSFYPPYHIGGDAVHVKYLAEALAEKGHEVHVLHSMDAFNFKTKIKNLPIKKTKEKSNVIVHTLQSPLGKLEPIFNYCFGTQKYTMNCFKELVKKEKFDVVHHHNISLLGHNILKKFGNYMNLYTAHDFWLVCHKYDMLKDNKKDICDEKSCLKCCLRNKRIYQFFRNSSEFKNCINAIDTVIAPSNFMAGILKKEFNNVEVIYNFISEKSKIKPKQSKIKDYFIFAGVLEDHKGILNLISVFSSTDKKLLLVGTGSLKKKIKLMKDKNIELLGWKNHEELFPLISSAQALILPSVCLENNPLILLESLSLGTPIIGSDSGGIPEIVAKIDKKLVFKKDDICHLKKIILHFDRKKYPYKKIKNIYSKNFSQEIFFKKYMELLEE
jgi:glycosyltransferase involved in cell wall biosynthesis